RVLDCDNGLPGEIAHQLNLLGGKRPDLLAINGDYPEQRIFLEHRHAKGRASAAEVGESDEPRIAFDIWRHRSDVVDLHDLSRPANLGMATLGVNAERHVPGRGEGWWHVVDRGNAR